ncbi:MAG TPA: di-heme-cytochrome C peroxidase [Nitrosomonas sp.]|nr:di-heme-cytochrome C peroxidase [Nitrosomonas sp.]
MKRYLKPAVLVIFSVFFGFNLLHTHAKDDFSEIVLVDGKVQSRVELDQGWSQEIRQLFWFTSQGSRIIPYNWFAWLEQADNNSLFRNVEHMEMLRYLPMNSSKLNPAGLPIGFALDTDHSTGRKWVGLTCAACHTNQIDYQGTRMLIEGAPTLANFVKFFDDLVNALNKTNDNPQKFTRFAKNVLGNQYSETTANKLHQELDQIAAKLAQRRMVNQLPPDYPEDFTSYARLDAFGNIQNAASAFALHDLTNRNAPTAPVSYPFLWGTHQSDVVQWNGSAPNTPIIGPLIRNMGEVVGVFGDLEISEAPIWKKLLGIKVEYSAHVDIHNLGKLELWVKHLRAPSWSDGNIKLPVIDQAKANIGERIYMEQCLDCHKIIPSNKQADPYKAKMISLSEVGTDSAMAINADYHMAKSLLLEGVKSNILIGDKFTATEPSIELAVNGVTGLVLKDLTKAIKAGIVTDGGLLAEVDDRLLEPSLKKILTGIKSKNDILEKYLEARKDLRKKLHAKLSELTKGSGSSVSPEPNLDELKYKARPLNGIWATAPYLHNGSVPNLWELLKKPEERVTQFWVGSRELDPVHVGFEINQGLSQFNVHKVGTKTIIPGNSNLGHDYGTDLSDDEKWSLIEYLKTL